MGIQRRRRRMRRAPEPEAGPLAPADPAEPAEPHRPSPSDLAERSGTFALTSAVHDPNSPETGAEHLETGTDQLETGPDDSRPTDSATRDTSRTTANRAAHWDAGPSDALQFRTELYRLESDDAQTERGLRGLVGGGSSQVSVTAAMRARDAARPTEADLAAAETELAIIRRGWVPREDLPRPGRR